MCRCYQDFQCKRTQRSTAYILDGMAIVQMLKAGGAQRFGELAEKYYQYITSPFQQPGCNRVDLVFDRYDKPYSIKGNERERRGSSSALKIKIIEPSTSVPKQWNKYISNPLHSCSILGAKSVNKNCNMDKYLSWEMHGFKECNKAVLVVKD